MSLLAAFLLTAQAEFPAQSAMALFEAACIHGQASLNRDVARRVPFRELPVSARRILRYALSPEIGNLPFANPVLRGSQAPTQIYRLDNPPNTYLLLPDRLSETEYSNVCALITRGDQFDDATRLIMGGTYSVPKSESPRIHVLPYMSTFRGGYRLSAAMYDGWTLASTVPEESPVGAQ
jgi:hypothetical protein